MLSTSPGRRQRKDHPATAGSQWRRKDHRNHESPMGIANRQAEAGNDMLRSQNGQMWCAFRLLLLFFLLTSSPIFRRTQLLQCKKETATRMSSNKIPIDQANARTLTKLDALQQSIFTGDSMAALVVAIGTQEKHSGKRAAWTRKIVLVTDGENPIEV